MILVICAFPSGSPPDPVISTLVLFLLYLLIVKLTVLTHSTHFLFLLLFALDLTRFFYPSHVFHTNSYWNLCDSNSLQILMILLRLLSDLSRAIV